MRRHEATEACRRLGARPHFFDDAHAKLNAAGCGRRQRRPYSQETRAQAKAYRIADNQTAGLSHWDLCGVRSYVVSSSFPSWDVREWLSWTPHNSSWCDLY